MGNKLDCCQPPQKDKEIVQVISGLEQDQSQEDLYRQGEPTNNIAIKIDDLVAQSGGDCSYEKLQKLVYKVKQHQKKNHKTYRLACFRKERNELPDTYYLPQLHGFYIGQWVLDKKFKQNLPKGIGRLYLNEWILQGVVETIVKIYKENSAQQDGQEFQEIISEERKLSMLTTTGLDYLVYYVKTQQTEIQQFQVRLNGMGRKFNRNQEFQGNFLKGQLHGKGTYQIKQPFYKYTGQWKHNTRHGKAIQKSRTFSYEGQFKENKKHGKGTLNFYLDKKQQHQIVKNKGRIERSVKQNREEVQKDAQKIIQKRLKFQFQLKQKLRKYQWKNPFYQQQTESAFDLEDFIIDRKTLNTFPEFYSGDFKDDQMDGEGSYQWKSGKMYRGQWKAGQIDGIGQFYWPGQAVYRGEYKDNVKHGKGQIIWCQNKRFRGSWAFGVRHGYGQLITIHSNVITIKGCLWNQDKQAKVFFQNEIAFPYHQKTLDQAQNLSEQAIAPPQSIMTDLLHQFLTGQQE